MTSQPRPDLTVTDIKNMAWCARTVYWGRMMGSLRPQTFKMADGKREHERAEDLEQRRSLRAYGLTEGERQFAVSLVSQRLSLAGRIDMVIRTTREVIPVEFKNTTGPPALHHVYQITAQALLLEENGLQPVRRGFLYRIPAKQAHEVTLTPDMRRRTLQLIERAGVMLIEEKIPPPTPQRGRCLDCEFRRLCGDTL